ncbi:MAG: transcriptional regulator, partial [Burkholderiaceae bacterium]|nr:transcriptional regulator [Burkholderiaceae bacterium]
MLRTKIALGALLMSIALAPAGAAEKKAAHPAGKASQGRKAAGKASGKSGAKAARPANKPAAK